MRSNHSWDGNKVLPPLESQDWPCRCLNPVTTQANYISQGHLRKKNREKNHKVFSNEVFQKVLK